jgi:hypothetical protein
VYDRQPAVNRTQPTGDFRLLSSSHHDTDGAVADFERTALASAFSSLLERWQFVLWELEVEESTVEDLATRLGMKPNGVAVLGFRAREGLRQAYASAHLDTRHVPADSTCRWAVDRLAKYERGKLSVAKAERLEAHLDECDECEVLRREVAVVGINMRAAAALGLIGGGPLAVKLGATSGSGTIIKLLDKRRVRQMTSSVGVAAGVAGAGFFVALGLSAGGRDDVVVLTQAASADAPRQGRCGIARCPG